MKGRESGSYYDRMWGAAINARPDAVSITSYNEWGEGTQIEPAARPEDQPGQHRYHSYDDGPDMYLRLTRKWSAQFQQTRAHSEHRDEL